MQYRKPHYYHDFSCIADQCPDTCCAGWQIVIDEAALQKYSHVEGDFGVRLLNSIDWSLGVFEQYEKRCSFLNDKNLCDIYQEIGAAALCDTCRSYPRHTEEFENLREFSLSLSCPAAAEMILGCEETVKLLQEEDELEEIEEDYEDFDFLLFGQLEDARSLLLKVVQDRSLSVSKRMYLLLKLSDIFQKALDEGWLFELNLEEKLSKFIDEMKTEIPDTRWQSMKVMLKDLQKLEVLRDEWCELLQQLETKLYHMDAASYAKARVDFETVMYDKKNSALHWEICQEQLLVFFIYTYFCGAVYDDMVYTKTVLAVFSTVWIEELLFAKWLEKNRVLTFSDIVKTSWQYAREIEHSDENLNLLEELFDKNPCYRPDALTGVFRKA